MDFKKKTEENEAVTVKVCKENGIKGKNKRIKKWQNNYIWYRFINP